MRGASNNYFEEIAAMCAILESAAKGFNLLLGAFSIKKLRETEEELQRCAKCAYAKKCSIESELYSDFITPIEREDIISIICAIERAVHSFLDVCLKMKIWGVSKSKGDAIEFSDLALRCSSKIKKLSYELEGFRKNKSIRTHIRDAAELARSREGLYVGAVSELVKSTSNRDEMLVWSGIYSSLDELCYRCECILDAFGMAILKNI